ncbi:unnamed protein product [Dovyalis caffra]|uniref:Uncharacterized protein n=1 Tax=Dovyalis caffra TaxID=77055 RepID=A0AAV1SR69_9ROSI|nr:unnamed protein product [Dovyalis caffra]
MDDGFVYEFEPIDSGSDLEEDVCDGTFFLSLLKEMLAVAGCFNDRAKKLLELHLASSFRKYFMWFKGKWQKDHIALVQEGKDLVTYALINTIVAMISALYGYRSITTSKDRPQVKSQSTYIEILQSPWLRDQLMAFHINLREAKVKSSKAPALFKGCSLTFDDDKPSLSCELFDSIKVDIDLTYFICPAGVYEGSLHLEKLNILLSRRYHFPFTTYHFDYTVAVTLRSRHLMYFLTEEDEDTGNRNGRKREGHGFCVSQLFISITDFLLSLPCRNSCHEYWEQRLQIERIERIRQAKKH